MSELAILGGPKTRTEPYPAWPVWDQRDIDAVTEVIKSGRWGGYPYPGPKTAELAKKFAELQGGGYAVPMANGTVTMEVALRASNIGWGDEVIVPAYTFQATASAPIAAGAIPVIVDVDPNTYCIDPQAAEKAVTARTKAIIPVHLGSNMADMDAIMALAERYNLIVIEDCAHAHGAKWRGMGAGTIGHFGSFSLQSSKTLTTGEGGILLCKTPELAARAASIIDCGRPHALGGGGEDDSMDYQVGGNFRLSEIAATLALVGIERFPAQAKQREEMAAYMDEALSEIPGVRVLKHDERHTTRLSTVIFSPSTRKNLAWNGMYCPLPCPLKALNAGSVTKPCITTSCSSRRNPGWPFPTLFLSISTSKTWICPKQPVPVNVKPFGWTKPFSAAAPRAWMTQ